MACNQPGSSSVCGARWWFSHMFGESLGLCLSHGRRWHCHPLQPLKSQGPLALRRSQPDTVACLIPATGKQGLPQVLLVGGLVTSPVGTKDRDHLKGCSWMLKAADPPESSRFDCKVKYILFSELPLKYWGSLLITWKYQTFAKVFFFFLSYMGQQLLLNYKIILCLQPGKEYEWSLF